MGAVTWIVAAVAAVVIIAIALVIIFVVIPKYFRLPPYVINPLQTNSVVQFQSSMNSLYLNFCNTQISGASTCGGGSTFYEVSINGAQTDPTTQWTVTQIDADNGVYAFQANNGYYLASAPASSNAQNVCGTQSSVVLIENPGNLPACATWVLTYAQSTSGGFVVLTPNDTTQSGVITLTPGSETSCQNVACLNGTQSLSSQFAMTILPIRGSARTRRFVR